MPIEKQTPMTLRRVGQTFTTLPNDTINAITDTDALAIWVYLASKPGDWIIRPEEVQEHFHMGRHRYLAAMTFLRDLGLIGLLRGQGIYGTELVLSVSLGGVAIPIPPSENQTVVEENHSLISRSSENRTPYKGKERNKEDKDKQLINTCDDLKKLPATVSAKDICKRYPTISEQLAKDWLQVRKVKRAPLTQTAWNAICGVLDQLALPVPGVTPETAMAIACEKCWRGLKVEWVLNELQAGGGQSNGYDQRQVGSGQRPGVQPRQSAAGSVRDEIQARRRERAALAGNGGEPLAGNGLDVRPQMGERVRGSGRSGRVVGDGADGDFFSSN